MEIKLHSHNELTNIFIETARKAAGDVGCSDAFVIGYLGSWLASISLSNTKAYEMAMRDIAYSASSHVKSARLVYRKCIRQ